MRLVIVCFFTLAAMICQAQSPSEVQWPSANLIHREIFCGAPSQEGTNGVYSETMSEELTKLERLGVSLDESFKRFRDNAECELLLIEMGHMTQGEFSPLTPIAP